MKQSVFYASLPPIQSAIKIGQDGARIQLDIPETELDKLAQIIQWRDKVLRITIEPVEGYIYGAKSE
ncbi:hypothetical protein ASJ33_05565 [Dehalococcoides mccartyi]|jgi:hypothetical protein|uniref:hypothetical protein n=1 Tax=Dehalococcoides TaxID=61434 RepID=UPI0004E085B2|nr:hypothetical protein [Dehalococcoides mccartyi]AII58729.1 hypothetical protein X792_05010 [Dehalococcoides mccartyi CG1]APH12656.1 hypothetical protein ASJ33_05565 [Dehalococcoides mccartyi]